MKDFEKLFSKIIKEITEPDATATIKIKDLETKLEVAKTWIRQLYFPFPVEKGSYKTMIFGLKDEDPLPGTYSAQEAELKKEKKDPVLEDRIKKLEATMRENLAFMEKTIREWVAESLEVMDRSIEKAFDRINKL